MMTATMILGIKWGKALAEVPEQVSEPGGPEVNHHVHRVFQLRATDANEARPLNRLRRSAAFQLNKPRGTGNRHGHEIRRSNQLT